MDKKKFKFKNLPLLTKSFLGFSLFLTMSLIISGLILNYQITQYSEYEINLSITKNLEKSKKLNDIFVESIVKQAIRLSLDSAFDGIKDINKVKEISNDVNNFLKANKVFKIINDTVNANTIIKSIYLYNNKADYVITSNTGITKLNSFTDKDWLSKYKAQTENKTGVVWLDTRIMGGKVQDPNSKDNKVEMYTDSLQNSSVITFILPMNNLMMNSESVIVVNLYEQEFYNLINSKDTENNETTFIINDKGLAVSYRDKNFLGESISNNQNISKILASSNNQDYFIAEEKSMSFLYSFNKTRFNNWIFVSKIPLDRLYKNVYDLTKNMIIVEVSLMLLGILFSYLYSKRVYSPVKEMLDDIKKKTGVDLKDSSNELTVLSKVFETLETSNIRNTMDLNRKYINDLLRQEFEMEKEEVYKELFPLSHIVCVVFAIDRYDNFCEIYPKEQQQYYKLMILSACELLLKTKYKVNGVVYEKDKVVIIVNFNESNSESFRNELMDCFVMIQNEVSTIMSNTLTVGVGSIYDNIAQVFNSYNEACEAVKKKMLLGKGKIIFYQKNFSDYTRYYYPYHIEKHILNNLKTLNKDEIFTSISQLVDEMKHTNGLNNDVVVQVFMQLVGNTINFLIENNINISRIFGNDYNIYSKLSSKETIEDIKNWLTGFYSGILHYISDEQSISMPMEDRILNYIHEKYKTNIDLATMADDLSIGYSTVGRMIKSITGKNAIEYINTLRIEEAKRLLKQTDKTVKNIAFNLGYNNEQSFSRFFKKYEGITPGEYRNIN